MQVVITVMAKSSLKGSLREFIIADLQEYDYKLEVEFEKKQGRPSGWAKIKADDLYGAINISWHANSKTLIARAVAKSGNTPDDLVGRFIAYLIHRRRKQIAGITMRPS